MTKIVVFGHSYVRDLANHDTLKNSQNRAIEYIAQPGANYHNLNKVEQVVQSQPEILVIILGGNDFTDDPNLSLIKEKTLELLYYFKERIPNVKLVVSQIEHRHYYGNPHSAVDLGEHNRLIKNYNAWLNRQKQIVSSIILTTGWTKNPDYFTYHGIHLNGLGVNTFLNQIYEILDGM